MQKTDKMRDIVPEGQAFVFRSVTPIKPCMFTLTASGGYLNAPAARGFAEEGAYLEILVDPSRQALKLNPCNDPGAGRYRIFKQSGASIQVRQKFLKFGMEYGIYLNVGGSVFQHIDHVS